jgi:hypothetical protein
MLPFSLQLLPPPLTTLMMLSLTTTIMFIAFAFMLPACYGPLYVVKIIPLVLPSNKRWKAKYEIH